MLTCLAIALVVSLLPAFTPTAEAATSFANRSAVIRTARRYLGRPYVFGANGPRYFDCSSFVRYVYRQHGIYLPRTAASQSRYGRAIPKSKLAAGDIVFFRNTYKRGISHVGIYIGSGRFIHAFPRRGVTVDSLYQRYFTVKYAGAKRVLR
ncbi:MAG: C40 family peptidase [Bacillota bacterium]